jgi:two-component system cell cycle sensor histidine kinase/response regulator CckA
MGNIRIMVVEDDKIFLRFITQNLEMMNYSVIAVVDSGEEAIEKAIELIPDIILMDINLSGSLNGVQAARVINEYISIPIIYLTANTDEEILEVAKLTGPFGYLHKPLKPNELKSVIEIAFYKHQMELKVLESEKKYRSIFENSLDVICYCSKDNQILEINNACFSLFGYKKDEIMAVPFNKLYVKREELEHFMERISGIGSMKNEEFIFRKKDGTETLGLVSAIALYDKYGDYDGFYSVIKDISEKKRLETQLFAAMKMESIGHLTCCIAHDFNNLLTVINGYVEILQTKISDKSLGKYLKTVEQAGEKAARLISQLMAYSRKQKIIPIYLDLNEVIEEFRPMMLGVTKENISLEMNLSPDPLYIYMDTSQIEQVLMNILINSKHAMPQGGKIRISSYSTSIDEDFVKINPGAVEGDYNCFSISDTGIGMDTEIKKRIFEPFFTTKCKEEGTGLGLASVYGIVKQNKGYLTVSSQLHQGTTFVIYLPRFKGKRLPKVPISAEVDSCFVGKSVLIVENEVGVMILLEHIFHSLGFKVLKANNPAIAFEIADEYQKNIDVFFADVQIESTATIPLIRKFESNGSKTLIILVSGYPDDVVSKLGIRLSRFYYLKKPFSKKSIVNKLKQGFKTMM